MLKPAVDSSSPSAEAAPHRPVPGRALLLMLASALLAAGVVSHPLGEWRVITTLALYSLLVVRFPRLPLVLLPALLPVLDLAPLTGRFYLDEFDLLLLTTMILANCRARAPAGSVKFPRMAGWLFGLFVLSVLVAIVRGMWPLTWPDLNSFNHYYSAFNGLRASKGLLWCVLLLPAVRQELADDAARTHRLFGLGMMLGVAAAAAVIVWERVAFPGLLNFGSSYRVAGAFSGMHNGGAAVEAYLVLGLPFVAWVAVMQRQWLLRLCALGIFILGSYCMMVTYARGGYVALILAMIALVTAIPFMRSIVLKPVQALMMVLLFALLAAVAVPVMQGSYMKGRFSTTPRDFAARSAHWMQALNLMHGDTETRLLGMGSGRYPALTFLSSAKGTRPATYRFMREADNTWLQLSSGDPLYFEQLVSVHPHRRYHLRFSARAADENAVLGLPLCEKWLLYSVSCFTESVIIGDTHGKWQKFEVEMTSGDFRHRPWHAFRPVKFALFNAGDASLEVDDVSLTENGQELIRNGGFEQVMDHWFFSTDTFEAWHFENTWLQLYFEQGAIGLALFVLLVSYAALFSATRLRDRDFPLPSLGAALLGFLALGTLDSLFDFPRLALVFFLVLNFIFLKAPMLNNDLNVRPG